MHHRPSPRTDYVFDRFRLSADGTMLTRDRAPMSLRPKLLRTLLVLVQRAGRVVPKEVVIDEVWPSTFVDESGLTRNICVLRKALGDDGERFIATVARVGYRFVAPVRRAPAGELPTQADADIYARDPAEPPVVGRDSEVGRLRQAYEHTIRGSGLLVAVTGEPGIGKSTIVGRFLEEIGTAAAVGCGQCSQRLAGTEPHLPILEALDDLTRTDSVIGELLDRMAPTWSRRVSAAPVDARTPGAAADLADSPQRLVRELTRFLDTVAAERPVVIVVEDLHWTDLATVDVLTHLAARLSRMSLMVVVTYRLHDLIRDAHPFLAVREALLARGSLEEVTVGPLTADNVRYYVSRVFDGTNWPSHLPGLIFRRSEGNPLFMADLVRFVHGEGLSDDTSVVRDVPESLRALIQGMLRRLEPEARELASVAALQGYYFDSATVGRALDEAPMQTEDRLVRLEHAHALVVCDRHSALPDGTVTLVYRFVHALYQDALYEAMTPSRRAVQARHVANALLCSSADRTEESAGQLAVLFETAREWSNASDQFLIASRRAVRRFAFREAATLADRGLRCLRAAPRPLPDVRRRELDLTFARMVPLASVEGYGAVEVETLAARIVELGEALGDHAATAHGLNATWVVRMGRAECQLAKDTALRLAEVARNAGNDVLLMNAYMESVIASHHLGEFAETQEYIDATIAMGTRVPPADRCIVVFDPAVAALSESSRNRWITGHLRSALVDADAAVALGRELRHPDSLALAWLFRGWVHGYRADWRQSLDSVHAGLRIANDAGSVQTLEWNRGVCGWAHAHLGNIESGLCELNDAIASSIAIKGHVALPQFYAMLAEVLLLRGDRADAEHQLSRATQLMNAGSDRYFAAEVHRLSAVCRSMRGATGEAVELLHTAIDVARAQGAKMFELRAALDLSTHDPGKAREIVATVLASLPEPEPWPDILRATRLLAPGDGEQ